jgi:hypothetical protein
MLRTKLAKKVLSKKEQKHLTKSNIHSMAAMKRQIDFMAEQQKSGGIICSDCEHIAKKLNMI